MLALASVRLVLALLLTSGRAAPSTRDTYSVVQAHTRVNGTSIHVWAPKTTESVPVFFFMGGFAGDAPATTYGTVLFGIAARGIYVVGLSRLQVPNYPREAEGMGALLGWAAAGGLKAAFNATITAAPDVSERTFVGGQSAGCHVVGQMLADGCGIAKGLALMDPVDGFDPFRIVTSQDLIHPPAPLNFTTPTLITRAGLDPKRANPFSPPCAPDKLSNDRFYYATRGPAWILNATAFGHVDCLDDAAAISGAVVCASGGLRADRAAYHRFLSGTIVSFAELLFNHAATERRKLEDAALVASVYGVDVLTAHDYHGVDPERLEPGCRGSDPVAVR